MKYFLAIIPPNQINRKIIKFQKGFSFEERAFLVEPHITVKSPNGLPEHKRWLYNTEKIIRSFPPFDIQLKEIGYFNDSIVFIKPCDSKVLENLHRSLVETIDPSPKSIKEFFEYEDFVPHLTLGRTSWGISEGQLDVLKNMASVYLLPLPSFKVKVISLFEHTENDKSCRKVIDIPLLG